MQSDIYDIIKQFADEPRISVIYTLNALIFTVSEIYFTFLQTIECDAQKIFSEQSAAIKTCREPQHKDSNILKGYVLYQTDESDTLHI